PMSYPGRCEWPPYAGQRLTTLRFVVDSRGLAPPHEGRKSSAVGAEVSVSRSLRVWLSRPSDRQPSIRGLCAPHCGAESASPLPATSPSRLPARRPSVTRRDGGSRRRRSGSRSAGEAAPEDAREGVAHGEGEAVVQRRSREPADGRKPAHRDDRQRVLEQPRDEDEEDRLNEPTCRA